MGEIEKVVEIGKLALRQQGATALTVANALLDQVDYEKAKEPKAPAAVAMTDELREALEMLPKVFGQAQVTEIRQLTETERRALGEEQRVVEAILKPLEMRVEAIKETVRFPPRRTTTSSRFGRSGPSAKVAVSSCWRIACR